MKFLIAVWLVCSVAAFADTPITKEQAAKVRSYDLDQLKTKAPLISDEEVLRIKFTYRSQDLENPVNGLSLTALENSQASVSVYVPADGLKWFLSLPTSSESRRTIIVIARIQTTGEDRVPVLLGREIKTDLKGSRVVW